MMALYRVLIEQDEDGVFVAECPSLPGCVSQGATRDEAVTNIKDAIAGYLREPPQAQRADPTFDLGSDGRGAGVSRLPVVSGQDAARVFAKLGYAVDHQTGSHIILRQQQSPHRRP